MSHFLLDLQASRHHLVHGRIKPIYEKFVVARVRIVAGVRIRVGLAEGFYIEFFGGPYPSGPANSGKPK